MFSQLKGQGHCWVKDSDRGQKTDEFTVNFINDIGTSTVYCYGEQM